ncbi:MAG: LacI family DNA-binding transcriptional regulator [Bacteroidota bacterium]
MKKKKVSLKDIANELGVSATLVSYVINNREKEGRVGKEMAKKIRATAERLNYKPNHFARSLKNQKSRSIGLILADISNPFFANMARIIEDEASKNNYTVIIGSSDERPEKMERVLNFLSSRQVDGFIIVPTENSQDQIRTLLAEKTPFVLVDRRFDDISCNSVMTDNFLASYKAVNHLIKNKSRRMGIVTYDSDLNNHKDRLKGYLEALKNNKMRVDQQLIKRIKYNQNDNDIYKCVKSLVDERKVDSIFFTTNTLTLKGLKAIHNLGLKISKDIEILAFDNNEVISFYNYPVTQVIQPIEKICKESIAILLDLIENSPGKISNTIFEGKLSR